MKLRFSHSVQNSERGKKNWKRHGHNQPKCCTNRKSCWPVSWRSFFQCKDSYVFMAFYFHQSCPPESHWASRREALSKVSRGCCHFLRFKSLLSVCCSQTVPLHRPQVHSRGPVHRTVYMDGCPLSRWMSQDAGKMKSQPWRGWLSRLGFKLTTFISVWAWWKHTVKLLMNFQFWWYIHLFTFEKFLLM